MEGGEGVRSCLEEVAVMPWVSTGGEGGGAKAAVVGQVGEST